MATDQPPGQWDVAVCVLTFRRPVGLERLFGHLARLAVPAGCRVGVIVVDNDERASAKSVVDRCATDLALPVRYVVEPVRGISQARNRALSEAHDAQWVGFIDDDDWPEPDWLCRLLATQAATGADIVLGPNTPIFEVEPPAWIVAGRFFGTERFETGSAIPLIWARTSGVLLRRSALSRLGDRPFAEPLGLVGGEDVTLFRQLATTGTSIIWDDEAVIHEVIPPSKARARWLIARGYRLGMARSTTLVEVEGAGWVRRLKRLGGALRTLANGVGKLVVARDRVTLVRAAQVFAQGCGLAAGALGMRFEEYRTVRGR